MDTIFVKNVKDDGPAHRAGLRTGELSGFPWIFFYLPGSLLPTLQSGWDSQIQAPPWPAHTATLPLFSRRPAGEGERGERHWEDLLPGHSSDPE